MVKIYIIAGEPSGDYLGSCLIKALSYQLASSTNIKFIGVGGPLMAREGLKSLFDISEISLMGFFEVLPHIIKLKRLINKTVEDIIASDPAILITIDSPGFTYRVAEKIRKTMPELKLIHLVAPSVWAYKPKRALKYAKIYNHLLALLPFEPQYFTRVGLSCTYIGHPILEQKFYNDKTTLKKEFNISSNEKVICVTPGSRKGEIIKHIEIFRGALEILAKEYPRINIIFVLSNTKFENFIKSYFEDTKLNISFSQEKLKIFALADVSLAKSGTNTIEIAASGTPMVVAYKLNSLTYKIFKLISKLKFSSLINIIADREIIPEFIQQNCTSQKIADSLKNLLTDDDARRQQITESQNILKILGFNSTINPSIKAAEIITTFLK